MKRIYPFLIILLFCLGLTACGCEHEWVEGTCLKAETCALCGEEQGEVLGHSAGQPELVAIDSIACTGDYVTVCVVCGETLDSEMISVDRFYDGDRFLLTPERFMERLIWVEERECFFDNIEMLSQQPYLCQLRFADESVDYEMVSQCVFYNGDTRVSNDDAQRNFMEMHVALGINRSLEEMVIQNTALMHVIPIVMACDPSADYFDGQDVFNELYREGKATANGIVYTYEFDKEANHLILVVKPEN